MTHTIFTSQTKSSDVGMVAGVRVGGMSATPYDLSAEQVAGAARARRYLGEFKFDSHMHSGVRPKAELEGWWLCEVPSMVGIPLAGCIISTPPHRNSNIIYRMFTDRASYFLTPMAFQARACF